MFKKLVLKILILLILLVIIFYIYLWFSSKQKYKVDYGISFSKQHAESLGLNWKENYLAMLDELKPKYLRFSATWDEVEKERGQYDFTEIDWQMNEAKKRGVKVILAIGQKAPRWPECHIPDWAEILEEENYKIELFKYLKTVVERYNLNEALEIWQVENEPFIKFRFGDCENYHQNLVLEEINFVKDLSPEHKIIITDSGELSTWRQATKVGDLFGSTLYRVVMTPGGRYWNYDWLPAGFYKLKAKFWGIDFNNFYISELQAEPWFTNSNPNTTDIFEQEKSMNIERMNKHFDYVERIGVSRAYLWGVEWWYWMKTKINDDRYWEIVKNKINN